MATPRIAEQIGRVLGGRYRLVAPIGTGASAHVYVADDARLNRRVAVKVLHPALAGDESFLRRFRAEAQAVAALRHPHIMNVYDWGEDEDGPFLVLEHLGGGSLRDVLDSGARLTPSQAVAVGREAARALDHAHRRGLVHRDIKPANLLFDDEGRLSIADFGLARALAEAAWTEPQGAVLGTARYASPEQAKGSSVDGRSDVYALALTLIEAVTGTVPFAADTTIATLMGRVDRPLEVPPALGPLVPVLEAASAPDPVDRIDAGDLFRRLDEVAAALPAPAPLPLAAPGADVDDPTLAPRDDRTFIGAPATAARAATPAREARPRPGAAPRLFDAEREVDRVEAERPRRRRGTKLLAALVAVAALSGGGFAVASAARPTFEVPDLRGATVTEARARVAGEEDFEVVEQRGDYHDEVVPPGRILDQSPLPDESLKQGEPIRVRVSDGPAPRTVPDLAGTTRAQAQQLLEAQQLVLEPREEFSETVAKDTVIDWSPKKEKVPRGGAVAVVVSKGPEPKELPSFLGKLHDEYQKMLEALGLRVKKEEAFSDKVEVGKVISTTPAFAAPGSEVTVVVSKGPEQVAVPNLNGLSEDGAAAKLQAAGLRLGDRFGPPGRTVFSTSPTAGSKVDRGSTIDVYTR